MDIKPLLVEAERLLRTNPRDNIHDLSHHQRVWQNVQKISDSLNQKVDKDVLQVATMWHDVMITDQSLTLGSDGLFQETLAYLVDFMEKHGFDSSFRVTVINAIKHHNFLTKHQMTVEGKVLFDADKLDALNPIRYRRIMAGIKNKRITRVQTFLIANAAKVWLKTMRRRYHFKKSQEMHDRLMSDLLKDDEAIQVAKEWGVDIVKLVK